MEYRCANTLLDSVLDDRFLNRDNRKLQALMVSKNTSDLDLKGLVLQTNEIVNECIRFFQVLRGHLRS